MKLRLRQQAPEPEPETAEVPTLGIHPMIDMLAMQAFILRQHANIFRHQTNLYRTIRRISVLYVFMALLWLVIAFEPLIRLALAFLRR